MPVLCTAISIFLFDLFYVSTCILFLMIKFLLPYEAN